MKLSELIKQPSFASAGQEAFLNVMVTSAWLQSEMTAAMAPHGVTPAQYNVLRILRGSHPKKLTCSDIGERLLDRTPDVTRLLNRLQRAGLIRRARADHDRRVVEVSITDDGLTLLKAMQADIDAVEQRITGHLSETQHRQVSELMETMRSAQTA